MSMHSVFENLWIYFIPGFQVLTPYMFTFSYNLILLVSLCFLTIKKNGITDLLNMFFTYYFLFALEINNTSTHVEFTEKNGRIDFTFGNWKYRAGIYTAGSAFFLYAVHARSKIFEIHHEVEARERLAESRNVIFTVLSWFKPKKPAKKENVSRALVSLLIGGVLKACFEVWWIYHKIQEQGLLLCSFAVGFNFVVIVSTIFFYKYRNVGFNIINILVTYSTINVLRIINSFLVVKCHDESTLRKCVSVVQVDNMVIFVVGGFFFVLTVYTRTLLLKDCEFSACPRIFWQKLVQEQKMAKQSSNASKEAIELTEIN